MFVTETVLEAMAGYFEFTRYIIDVWGLAANIDSKSRKKIMNATIFQHIGSLLSGHHPYSQRDVLDTANSRVPGKKNKYWRCRQARCPGCGTAFLKLVRNFLLI